MSIVPELMTVAVVILSAIPLNLAVRMLGGETSLLKVIIVNFLVAVASILLSMYVDKTPGLLSFIALIVVYRVIFDIGWFKAIAAWLLQFVIAVILILILYSLDIRLGFL